MAQDVRGTDVVIIGALIWLIWKSINPQICMPSNMPNTAEPQSSMTGPAWTRNIEVTE